MKRKKERTGLIWVGFLLWSAFLLWLLIFRRLDEARAMPFLDYLPWYLVLTPLGTILTQVEKVREGDLHALINLAGNVFLFLPLGWAMPRLLPGLRRFWRFLLCIAAAIVCVELAQLVLQVGLCDVDDLILNCLGGSMGYLLWRLICRKERPQKRTRNEKTA